MIVLAAQDLGKQYGGATIVEGISLTLEKGDRMGMLGPNGAGKSTIIKCVAGLLRFQGQILVAGHANDSLEAKHALGYVPEMPAVYELLTVGEHVEFIRRAYRLGDEANAYADALLERFEMDDKRDKLGKELSKGMQQKLSVICALLPRPEVVIFDEPLVGLDPHAIKELKELFGELKRGGASVLISTHMIDSVEDFWDVAHIMMNGRFAATRENREGVDEKPLEQLFFEITERDKGERA